MLGLCLLLLHTFLVVFMAVSIAMSDDGEAVMGWILFEFIDFPVSMLLFPGDGPDINFVVVLLLLGGIQWFAIGFGVENVIRRLCR